MIPPPHKTTLLGTPKRIHNPDIHALPKELTDSWNREMDTWNKIPKDFRFEGLNHGFPLCCVMFFWNCWFWRLADEIPEYGETMATLTENQGKILCPTCLIETIKGVQR